MELGIAIEVSPTKVGCDRLARELVREDPLARRRDEGELAQPLEDLVRVGDREELGQERLGEEADERTGLERRAMSGPRHVLDEALEQRLDQVGRFLRLKDPFGAVGPRIGHQRERERVTVREVDHRVALLGRKLAAREIGETLLRAQIAKRDRAKKRLPSRIGTPRRLRREPARHHHQRVGRKLRQEPLAQPCVERKQCLAGVEDEHVRPLPRGKAREEIRVGHELELRAEREQERLGIRLDVLRVEIDRG